MGTTLVCSRHATGSSTGGSSIYTNIYGIRIQMGEYNDPTDAVVYTDDAEGFEPLSVNQTSGECNYGSWFKIITEVFGVRPCLFNAGVVTKYLNINNYAQDTLGQSVDITSGADGDVMVEFSKCWYRYYTSGDYLYFKVTAQDMSGEAGWNCDAFYAENGSGLIKDHFYYGAFEGYRTSTGLHSLSGKTPTVNRNLTNFRTDATRLGEWFQVETIVKRMYLIGLGMLVTKSRDPQVTIGQGDMCPNNADTCVASKTGLGNTRGLFYGLKSNTTQDYMDATDSTRVTKFFGIEHFWGGHHKWMEGILSDDSLNFYIKKYGPFNNNRTNYIPITGVLSTNVTRIATVAPYVGGSVILPTVGEHTSAGPSSDRGWYDRFGNQSKNTALTIIGDTSDHAGYMGYWGWPVSTASINFTARIIAC